MENKTKEIRSLIYKYGSDRKRALQENSRLDYLYALSDQREALLEWFPFRQEGSVLQVGADYGAMTGLYARRVKEVTVLDQSEEELETVKLRYEDQENIHYVNGTLCQGLDPLETFDYVVIVGTLKQSCEEMIQRAKERLKPNGILLLAVCNPFGLKYWAGAERDEICLSGKELKRLLGDTALFYYPMADYKIPTTIYSDRYLPKKGDLTNTLTAYDYPKYLLMDVGAGYDSVCEDGQFHNYANSYLVLYSPDQERLTSDEMPVFVKYNKTRREQFQIKTAIFDTAKGQIVEKSALDLAGAGHIWSFKDKYTILTEQSETLKAVAPSFVETQDKVCFPYLEGKTWAEELGNQIKNGKTPSEAIRDAMNLVFDLKPEFISMFVVSEGFLEVFGKELKEQDLLELQKQKAYTSSNIDGLFENILMTETGNYCLDYEWVFDFPIPCEFVQYRTLFYFYQQYHSLINCDSQEHFLEEFGLEPEMIKRYQAMERSFQEYVHGDNQRIFQENFMVETKNARELKQVDGELERTKERLEQLKLQMREKDQTIRKMTEVQRLTNNHVSNLEVIIKDLRHEIGEMAKTMDYLNRHEAVLYKIRRKLGQAFNERYPKGTPKRKKLSYLKEYCLHPIRSFRYYSTEEGKNRKEGDFEIGDRYRIHGRLVFEEQKQPLVSIIIPVYNQIHYTYACLVSILEHTKGISYEVIIGDDVSTDATKNLERYVSGVKICRNLANEGFLLNCNQAAATARGKYLMFLNNDTQVTEGWLKSLIDLMESDPSIGMTGSKLVYPDGRLQEAGGIIWSDGSGWNYGRLDNPDKPEYQYVKDVDYISGAAIMIPTALWKQIGGFDSRYIPAYYEDTDLAFEVRRAGYRVVYQPLSKVIHFEGISNGTDVEGSGLKRYQRINAEKFREKWADELKEQYENTGNPDPFRARERSKNKPVVLVIDHYVPTFDRDAGSKATYQMINVLLNHGYQVKFLGDNFLHEEPYSTILQQQGVELLYGADYQTGIWDWMKDHGDEIAAVYLNRPHIASKYIDFIKENTKMRVIYCGHDLHFLREGREYALTGDVKKRDASMYWKSVELSLMHKADMSYYFSSTERDMICNLEEDIPVKCIPIYGYRSFLSHIPEDFEKREGLLFVGGFAHPPNADAVLWFAKEVFPVIREQEKLNFYIVGSKAPIEILNLEQPGNGIIVKGFVSDEELSKLYQTCRVVVVPLRFGAGVKGKVIEALYYGAPVVTTPIGAEGIEEAQRAMVIKEEAAEFADAVLSLYRNPDRCRDMCHTSQIFIRQYFSEEALWNTVRDDFAGKEPVS